MEKLRENSFTAIGLSGIDHLLAVALKRRNRQWTDFRSELPADITNDDVETITSIIDSSSLNNINERTAKVLGVLASAVNRTNNQEIGEPF